jgi:hypothetical protein
VGSGALTASGTAGYYDHQNITVNLPGSLAPGTYYIGGIADYTNGIAESNEVNNNYNVRQITVTAGPSGAVVMNGAAMAITNTPGSIEVDWLNQIQAGQHQADTFDLPTFSNLQGLFAAVHQYGNTETTSHDAVWLHHYLADFHLV